MVYNNVILTVKDPAQQKNVAQLLAKLKDLSLTEDGCERFEVYQSQTTTDTFFLIEHWRDDAALEQHRQAPAFTEIYQPLVLPHVNRSPHLCDLL